MQAVLLREEPDLTEIASEFGEFTTVRPSQDVPRLAISLVSLEGDLEWIGLLERGVRVATRKRRVQLSDLVAVEPPLSLEQLAEAVPPAFRRHIGYGPLPARTSEEVFEAVARLRPDLADAIERWRGRTSPPSFRRRGFDVAAMEKDAVGLALSFQGLDRAPLEEWTPEPAPEGFLRGLSQAVLREDQILMHDLGVFGGWGVVQRSAVGAVHYEQGGVGLTVVNVNRTPVEEALGVDLVYYHERYQSFVLVQYKRLRDEEGLGLVYRPDATLERELALMRQIVPTTPNPVDELSYRLGPGVCFIKLCKSVVFDPYSRDLISGMYLPLEYFDACAPTAVGPNEGRAYGYSTLPRHLNNSQFIDLVQDAWVGSNGTLTDALRQTAEDLVEHGRSVLLAVGRGQRPRRAQRG